jgi:hypothetical protein
VHIIAHGDITTGGDIAKAIACGADAVMLGEPLAAGAEMPGRGMYWDHTVSHPNLPRSALEQFLLAGERVMLSEVLIGPHLRPDRPPQPLRRAAPLDGQVRLLNGEGVPAGGAHPRLPRLRPPTPPPTHRPNAHCRKPGTDLPMSVRFRLFAVDLLSDPGFSVSASTARLPGRTVAQNL